MITTEQGIDMMPYIGNIFEKIDIKEIIEGLDTKNPDKTATQIGIDFAVSLLKKTPVIKDELFNIVAIATSTTVETIKKQSFWKTAEAFKGLLSGEDFIGFFKDAMQSESPKP